MSQIEKITKAISLQEEKKLLERKLLSINENIKLNQKGCSHVGVYMGNNDHGSDYKCVLCNCNLSSEKMIALASNGLVIYAHDYLVHVKPSYMERFEAIQTMFLGLCKENEFASNKEIVCMLQEIINRSLESKVEVDKKDNGNACFHGDDEDKITKSFSDEQNIWSRLDGIEKDSEEFYAVFDVIYEQELDRLLQLWIANSLDFKSELDKTVENILLRTDKMPDIKNQIINYIACMINISSNNKIQQPKQDR